MNIVIRPTKIKTSVYLLVPKGLVDYGFIDINANTKFTLKIKKDGKRTILQYIKIQQKSKRKERKQKSKRKERKHKTKRRKFGRRKK